MPIRLTSFIPISVTLATAAAGCGGGDGGPSSNPNDLVASWREVPSSFQDPSEADLLEISEGDRFMLTESDGTINIGEWAADDRELTFTYHEDGQATDLRSRYIIDGTRLLTGALIPDGEVDGSAGTWRGDASIGSLSATMTITLEAGGAAHYVVDRSQGEDDDRTGTWRHDGGDVVLSFEESGFTLNVHFQELPGIAIGGPMYQRL